MGYLFGSILSITENDIYYMIVFSILLILFIIFNYRIILGISYDSEFTQLQGIQTNFFSMALMILIALGILLMNDISFLLIGIATILIGLALFIIIYEYSHRK